MLILTLRTDNPEAEIGLFDDHTQLAYETWSAHRELAETIHIKIAELLKSKAKTLYDLGGIVCFEGPGSFTGLRIGLTVGNALAYGLKIAIVATKDAAWISDGIDRLRAGDNDSTALPNYGMEAHITAPKR